MKDVVTRQKTESKKKGKHVVDSKKLIETYDCLPDVAQELDNLTKE